MPWSSVILAGGQSTRMGRDKAWLQLGGKPLLQLAVEKVRAAGAAEVFISGKPGEDYSSLKCPVLLDLEPGFGPMGGIERALRLASSPLVLVLAVDLPQMTPEFLRKLASRCDRFTGAVPMLKGAMEPLAAIYPRRCHSFASTAILKAQRAVRDFAEHCLRERAVRTLAVPARDARCFTNWNSPADVTGPEPCAVI